MAGYILMSEPFRFLHRPLLVVLARNSNYYLILSLRSYLCVLPLDEEIYVSNPKWFIFLVYCIELRESFQLLSQNIQQSI